MQEDLSLGGSPPRLGLEQGIACRGDLVVKVGNASSESQGGPGFVIVVGLSGL